MLLKDSLLPTVDWIQLCAHPGQAAPEHGVKGAAPPCEEEGEALLGFTGLTSLLSLLCSEAKIQCPPGFLTADPGQV